MKQEYTISKDLLDEIIEFIENHEHTIEGEWGSCRSIKELIKDNEMPYLWHTLKSLKENGKSIDIN